MMNINSKEYEKLDSLIASLQFAGVLGWECRKTAKIPTGLRHQQSCNYHSPIFKLLRTPPPSAFSVSTTWLITVNRCQLMPDVSSCIKSPSNFQPPPSRGESNTSKAPSSRCNAAARHCISSTPDSTEAAEGEAASCICDSRWVSKDPSWWIQLRVEWMDGSKLVMISIWF